MDVGKRKNWLLLAITAFANFAISIVYLAMVYHLRSKFSMDSSLIGIASSVVVASYFISCTSFEFFYEKMKPFKCVRLSLILMTVSSLCFALAPTPVIAFASLIFFGFSQSFLWPQLAGWLNRGKEGKLLARSQSGFNMSWSLATGLSQIIAGILAGVGTSLPLFASSAVFAGLLLVFSSSVKRIPGIDEESSAQNNAVEEHMKDHSTYLRFFTWAGLLLTYLCLQVYQVTFPLYALEELGISEALSGTILMIRGLVAFFVFAYMGRTKWWQFNKALILLSQLFLGVLFYISINTKRVSGFCIAVFILGIVFSINYNLSIFHCMSGSINKSRRMMIHESVLAFGQVAGGLFGGFLYKNLGWADLMTWGTRVVLATVAIEAVLLYLIKRMNIQTEMATWNEKEKH